MITLRPDQLEAKANVYREWDGGHKNVLLVASTGWGKSILISDVALDRHQAGYREFIGAHRNELVGQMSMHIARRGIPHRIIASKTTISEVTAQHREEFNGRSFINPTSNCSVGSVDTVLARMEALKDWAAQIDVWTMDEAHHCQGNEVRTANKWGKVINLFRNARGLGVTASPRRADGGGLGRYQSDGSDGDGPFHSMVQAPNMRWLIDNGALSDYEIAIPESDFEIDDADLAPSGDWSTARMREASKKSHIVGDVVKEYVKRAIGKRFLCFATDVETAGEIAANFNAVGIPVAAVSAKTPTATRNEYIRRFKTGAFWGLINVDLFGEGFDVPACEVVIMARPTASLAVYLQQFGRALRILAGKLYGLVIDHVSNWFRHGFPDKEHYWSLDRREKRAKKDKDPEEIELTACGGCSRPYERCLPACPKCGWSPPLVEPSLRTIAMVDGDLTLLTRETCAAMRAAVQLETPAAIAERVAFVAGPVAGAGAANRQIEKLAAQARLAEAIAVWSGYQRAAGRSDSEIYRRWYLTMGMDMSTALAADDRAKYVAMAEQVEGWI